MGWTGKTLILFKTSVTKSGLETLLYFLSTQYFLVFLWTRMFIKVFKTACQWGPMLAQANQVHTPISYVIANNLN